MIYSLGYILTVALFGIIIRFISIKSYNVLTTPLLIFLVTLYSIIIFHIANRGNILNTYKKVFSLNKWDVIILPTLVTVSLVCSFYIPLYYNPSVLSFTFMAINSFCASISFFAKNQTKMHAFILFAYFMIIVIFYVTHFKGQDLINFTLMVAATLICAVSSYSYLSLSHKFNQAGLNAIEVLTFRFWPLCIIFGAISIINGDIHKLSIAILPETFLTSIITFALPVYLSQKAIEKVGASIHGMMLGFTPFLTFILENLVLKIHDFSMLFFSTSLAFVVITQNILRLKYNK